jgi:glycosyltransferase involved in cell wall biosynthesis
MTMTPPGLVLPDMWRTVRNPGRFDLVHASAYPSLMYLGLVAARQAGAKLVLMPCSHPEATRRPQPVPRRRLRHLYCQADALLAMTDLEREMLLRAGVEDKRIRVTGAGVRLETAAGADGARFRSEHGLETDSPIIAFVGHKTPGKGALTLLDASQQLIAEHPKLTLAMCGEDTPAFSQRLQSLPEHVRARVLDLRLSEQEKHDMLAASSLLVLPSRDDSFGIVLLEAWLHGLPVIGARAGGIPAVIEEGRTGLLVPFGHPDALREAISWMWEHPARAAALGARGRETTLQQRTWDAVYPRVEAAYRDCLSS